MLVSPVLLDMRITLVMMLLDPTRVAVFQQQRKLQVRQHKLHCYVLSMNTSFRICVSHALRERATLQEMMPLERIRHVML
jgi:hypothetical protein